MKNEIELYSCDESNATKIHEWILNRGGIFIWRSVNLSNSGGSWTSPARDADGNEVAKPNWQCDSKPERHITKIEDVSVITAKEVKRFHVATRGSGNGLSIKVTDGGTRKIRAEVSKAERGGRKAWYEFEYFEYGNCVIMVEDSCVPMTEWLKRQNCEVAL